MMALQTFFAAVLAFSCTALASPTHQGQQLVPCKTNSDCQTGQQCLNGWAFSKGDQAFCGLQSKPKRDLVPCQKDDDCEVGQQCIEDFFFSKEGDAYCGYAESKRQLVACETDSDCAEGQKCTGDFFFSKDGVTYCGVV